MRSDRLRGLQHLSAEGRHATYGVANASVDVHVNEDARRRDFLCVGNETAAISLAMFDYAEAEVIELCPLDLDAQNGSVKRSRAVEIDHGQIEPDDAIVSGIHVAHDVLLDG